MVCKYIVTLYVCFYPAFFVAGIGQEIPHFLEKLTTVEGLSSNTINDIVQDDNGFLWIATSDGLNRFDGTEVTQFFYQKDINSLPHNYVYCLKKLPGNYLAIGTHAGLSFYNVNTGMFENFYYQQNTPLDEYNNTIVKLEIDSKGNLWAGSGNGIFIFDAQRKLKKVISSSLTEADVARQRLRFVEKILPLPDGYVLLGLHNGWHIWFPGANNFTRLENSSRNKQLKFLNDFYSPQIIVKTGHYFPYSHVFKIFERYFLFIKPGEDSLLLFDEKGRELNACFFPYNKYPYVSWSHQVSMIDSTRLLFLFHNYGLAMLSVSWQNNNPVIHNISAPLFETNEYINALRDRQGNWWLATTGEGLQKISPYKQNFKSSTLINNSSGSPTKYEVISTTRYNNTLWVATYGDGFFEINLLSGKQQQHRLYKDDETVENFIWNVRQVNADTLWLGTQAGIFWYRISAKKYGRLTYPDKPPALDSVSITTQFIDSHGLVWMGLGKGKGVCYFDTKKRSFTYYPGNTPGGYPLRYPTYFAEDKKGNLWLVSDASTVLVYWNRNTKQFQNVTLPSALQKQLSNLCGIWNEDDSILWLGSITSGLIKFRTPTGSAIIYGHDKGLANSHVSNIYQDKAKRLWLATDGGLSCFNQQTETFSNYSSNDGLPVKYSTAFFYYDTADKRLYNGGHGALFYFDPDKMDLSQPPQKTMITALQVNGKPYMLYQDKAAKFRASQNDITISYTSVDLTSGPKTKYAYKLMGGEDTGWSMAGRQRQINFSRLAPGNYTFIVRASNSSGEWSKEASISFYIRPPFVQTAWFYILILLAMAGVFYAMYRFRLRELMRTEQIRSEISRNLHDEVGSTLTNISLSSLLARKQLHKEGPVTRILERIYEDSQNVSEAMREIIWSINPKIDTLGESLPRMLRYASELLEAKDIELQAEIAPEIEHTKLSMPQRRDLYLIFKEAVNNLAKHSKAKQAIIRFHLINNILVMIIADDGIGFDTNAPLINNGLRNMQERAKNHHWQLHIKSEPGAGTSMTLKA
jgi:streptogramin lyase/two-component sensor histidine kinase